MNSSGGGSSGLSSSANSATQQSHFTKMNVSETHSYIENYDFPYCEEVSKYEYFSIFVQFCPIFHFRILSNFQFGRFFKFLSNFQFLSISSFVDFSNFCLIFSLVDFSIVVRFCPFFLFFSMFQFLLTCINFSIFVTAQRA